MRLNMVEQLKLFFAINETIVQFVHGQVFLVLGVVMGIVAQQWQQRSRLELANALPWLACFRAPRGFRVGRLRGRLTCGPPTRSSPTPCTWAIRPRSVSASSLRWARA